MVYESASAGQYKFGKIFFNLPLLTFSPFVRIKSSDYPQLSSTVLLIVISVNVGRIAETLICQAAHVFFHWPPQQSDRPSVGSLGGAGWPRYRLRFLHRLRVAERGPALARCRLDFTESPAVTWSGPTARLAAPLPRLRHRAELGERPAAHAAQKDGRMAGQRCATRLADWVMAFVIDEAHLPASAFT